MKLQIATLIAAGLVAGGALAQQNTTSVPLQGTATAPLKAGSPIEPAGGAQGRTPTSVNTPQTGPKMASPKGAIDKGVVSTPEQAQGSTSTAPENVIRHDNKVQHPTAPRDGMGRKTDRATVEKGVSQPDAPITLTTPAPGPANTTPAGPATGAPPATRK